MASFTVRVELHNADSDDYDTLHEKMAEEGFRRTIIVEGVSYYLPTAEYILDGEFTRKRTLDKADTAAKETGLAHSILVTEANRRLARGLAKA
jgi:hypothetical protein